MADGIMAEDAAGSVVFERVEPVVPVRDLAAALERYRRMGFSTSEYRGAGEYGFATRGGVTLHVSQWSEHDPGVAGAVVYLYVSDADALHTEWAAADLPGRITEPADTEYGLREFGYVDPDGTAHRVGSPL